MRRAIAAAAAVVLAIVMAMFSPAAVAREPLPVVPDGCVWTGGGLACGVGSSINDPAEPAPDPAPVDTVEESGQEQPPAPAPESGTDPAAPEPAPSAPEQPAPVEPPSCG